MVEAERDFLAMVLSNSKVRAIVDRAAELDLPDWWLTGGAVFQSVWNVLAGRSPEAGILDYDLFYFDGDDLSAASECDANRAAATLFADLAIHVEVANEARVHLWYEREFGVPGRRFASSCDAIDHFAAITCCYGVTRRRGSGLAVYAPHGFDDLLQRRVRANPVLVSREVYERKSRRWEAEWPALTVEPWPPDLARERDYAPRRSPAPVTPRCESGNPMPDLDVVAVLKAKAGSESVLEQALSDLVAPTLAEDGCLSYTLFRSTADPTTFITIERWRSQDDLDAHLQTPHIAQALQTAGDALDGGPAIHPLAAVRR